MPSLSGSKYPASITSLHPSLSLSKSNMSSSSVPSVFKLYADTLICGEKKLEVVDEILFKKCVIISPSIFEA